MAKRMALNRKTARSNSKSLFDPGVFERWGSHYAFFLNKIVCDSGGLIERDLEIVRDIAADDIFLWRQTYIAGSLSILLSGRIINCEKSTRRPVVIDGWMENDRLKFKRCHARGVLYVESEFLSLWRSRAWEQSRLILVGGHGVPGLATLRILHRMSTELQLPVYVLTSSDTWGYFIFSVIKRGSVAPHINRPEFAVRDLRFLGLRAGELSLTDNARRELEPWKDYWSLRLKALKRYPCFQSQAWKNEFASFRKQKFKFGIAAFAAGLKRHRDAQSDVWQNFTKYYVASKLKKRDWLT